MALTLRRRPRVLLLDDDSSMRKLISKLLERAGYRVDAVPSGSQAIEAIAARPYAAFLLDVMTPTEGGLTVIRHLRETDSAKLAKVVLVTASPDSATRAVSADIAGLLKKPFEPQELVDIVNRVAKR